MFYLDGTTVFKTRSPDMAILTESMCQNMFSLILLIKTAEKTMCLQDSSFIKQLYSFFAVSVSYGNYVWGRLQPKLTIDKINILILRCCEVGNNLTSKSVNVIKVLHILGLIYNTGQHRKKRSNSYLICFYKLNCTRFCLHFSRN